MFDDDMLSQPEIDALLGYSSFDEDDNDDNIITNQNNMELYDFDSLFEITQQIRVPYPEYLINELKTCFRNNKQFVNALEEGKANAISYLDDLNSYSKNKRQLDAYSNLYTWLIENNIEFIEKTEKTANNGSDSSEKEIIEDKYNEVNGSDDEQIPNNKSTEHSNKKMNENDKDEKGNIEDGSYNKSSEKTENIQENKDGKVSKEDNGQESQNSSEQSSNDSSQQLSANTSSNQSSSNSQQKSQQQSSSQQKQNSGNGQKTKTSLKDSIKQFFGLNNSEESKQPQQPNKITLPQKEQSIKETKKDIKDNSQGKIRQDLLDIVNEIQKDFTIQENDSDGDKIESEQDNGRHDLVRPGGRAITKTKAEEIIKEWIERMAVSGVHLKTTGYEKWDKKKIAKYLITEQEWRIPTAKYKHLPDKIMFMLDFSGSCSWISKTFAQLGHAATHYDHVIVAYGGYEGYVQGFITKDTDINNIEQGLRRYGFFGLGYGETADKYEDISLGSYLQRNKDIKTVIILGDYDGTERYVDAYLRNRQVNFTWFLCERYSHYRGLGLYGLKNHIYYFDGSVEGLAKLVKTYK